MGTYQVAGTDSDSSTDTGGWTFSLSVTAVTIAQSVTHLGHGNDHGIERLPQPARDVSGRVELCRDRRRIPDLT